MPNSPRELRRETRSHLVLGITDSHTCQLRPLESNLPPPPNFCSLSTPLAAHPNPSRHPRGIPPFDETLLLPSDLPAPKLHSPTRYFGNFMLLQVTYMILYSSLSTRTFKSPNYDYFYSPAKLLSRFGRGPHLNFRNT